MKEVVRILNRLTSVRDDISKHIVGGVYSNWAIMVFYIVLGRTAGIISAGVFVLAFIFWELYNKKQEGSPFSVTDVLAAVITIMPSVICIIGVNHK